jgi:hypothetical protein
MIISAISDLDILGLDLEPFYDTLKKASKPDLLLFAGDMYETILRPTDLSLISLR